LAIEAALMATNRTPGLYRTNYAFMHLLGYDDTVYEQEKALLQKQVKTVENLKIIATDLSTKAIENAKKNAIAAGVENIIDFAVCDFALTDVPQGAAGVMMVNPEYGERLGDETELEETYTRIGDFMKQKCGGYFGYVFTGNLDLAKKIGLKAKRRIEFYNSTIDCRLLEYELYAGSKRQPKETEA
jgi:putative N6-adenine-specific DNA methylase